MLTGILMANNTLFLCLCSMYAAIAHQINRGGVSQSVQQLRNLAADFMRSNIDDFMPFMDEVENEEQYVKYCDDIQLTAAWGSQLEVRALFILLDPCSVKKEYEYFLTCRGKRKDFD